RAKLLLDNYESLSEAFNDMDNWGKIKGIGKQTIKKNKELFHSKEPVKK
ncbi:unnamed protein product, partial [marine sediment metagenome]